MTNKQSTKKHILIVGSDGQLGQAIQEVARAFDGLVLHYVDKEDLDIRQAQALENYIAKDLQDIKLELVVNCAAYTAVDKAEEEQEQAYAINHLGVEHLAHSCQVLDLLLLHVSTDYVFSGKGNTPYQENDTAEPINIYGKSKLAGEQALNKIMGAKGLVLRTAWLYSEYGQNFALKILGLAKEREELSIVADQIGSPTYAPHLAEAILNIVLIAIAEGHFRTQCLHFTNLGSCSWFDLTQALVSGANISCNIKPIKTEEYPTPAPRPMYSVLNKKAIREYYGIEPKQWQEGVSTLIKKLDKNK